MNKLKVALVILVLFLLCGCATESTVESRVYVYSDDETGCDYLIYSSASKGGITPRMNADGTQYCKEE